jgi:DNA-binding PucR family transcriptional regulator
MAKAHSDDAAIITRSAAAVVNRLGERLAAVTGFVQQTLLAEMPELRGDPQLLQLMRDSVDENVATVLSAIRHAIPIERIEPPTAALERARRLAQRGVSVNVLVRAYRLGHKAVLNVVLDEVRASKLEPQLSLDVFGQIAEITFGYVDWVAQQALITYQSERDRWMENRNSLRALHVRELLDGADIDVDAAVSAIRYPLRGLHLAIVVWCAESVGGDELALMERYIRQLAEALNAHHPLFVPVDRLTGWAWIALPADAAPNATARIRAVPQTRPDAPWIAVGNPLPGVEGFRRSHQQAQDAHNVAIAAGSKADLVTAASDPGLSMAALLADNLSAARAWVGDVLGPLSGRTDNDERLRETLRVFLRTGSSFKNAAEELHLHFNSVKYRVQRAIDRRGRSITDDRLDVEVALLLCHWYGAAMLS